MAAKQAQTITPPPPHLTAGIEFVQMCFLLTHNCMLQTSKNSCVYMHVQTTDELLDAFDQQCLANTKSYRIIKG